MPGRRRLAVVAAALGVLAAGGGAGAALGAAGHPGSRAPQARGGGAGATGAWRPGAGHVRVGRRLLALVRPVHRPAPAPATTTAPGVPVTTTPVTTSTGVTTTGATTTSTTTTPPPPPPPLLRSGAELSEYAIHLTHAALDAGAVELIATNYGMDDHDLTVSRDGVVVAQSAVLPSHTEATVSFAATPGTYRVYCSLLGGAHDAAGMHATLTVG